LVGFATEEQIIKLSVGATAGARLVDGREIIGQVTFLSRSADQQTRTYRVEITAPNENLAFRDGATAEILVGLDGEKGHLVPQSALTLNDSGLLGLRTVENDRARFMPVGIIRDTANGTWVSGLPDMVDVIVVGQEFVTDGRAVTPVLQDDAS
jgi:multidrug efflux system membrane fusion protein